MTAPRPTHLVITLSESEQDGRDLYSERRLACAACGRGNAHPSSGWGWVLPGLCSLCAIRVKSVTVAAPIAGDLFSHHQYPD